MINTTLIKSPKELRYVKVLGQLVEIKPVNQEELNSHFSEEERKEGTYHGYYDELGRRIYVLESLDMEAYRRILLHEVVHAYLRMCGLQEVLKSKHEEMICTTMENLVELFRDETFVAVMQEGGSL